MTIWFWSFRRHKLLFSFGADVFADRNPLVFQVRVWTPFGVLETGKMP